MRRLRRTDGLLAAVLVLQALAPHTGGGEVGATAGAIGTTAAVGQVLLLLLLRRRRSTEVAALGVVGLYAVQVVAVDVVPPVASWVALWWLATKMPGQRRAARWTAGVTAVVVLAIVVGEAAHDGVGLGVVMAGVTVAVSLAALLRRSERGRIAAVAAQAATGERLRIARDLHDLAGHGLGVVAVQSSTARMALDSGDQDAARTALAAVEASSRAALKEMRQMLGVLRDAGAAPDPAPGLVEIATLVEGVRAGGVPVRADITAMSVSADVGLCVYRVVQEALTNVVKHSPGGGVSVVVEPVEGAVRVQVVSTGTTTSRFPGGSGLDGISARVTALGGTASAGPTADGWSVEAVLPLEVS